MAKKINKLKLLNINKLKFKKKYLGKKITGIITITKRDKHVKY